MATGCPDGFAGDGLCDLSCDNAECDYDMGDCPRGTSSKMDLTYFTHKDWTKNADGYVDIVATAGFDYMVLEDVDDCLPDSCPVNSNCVDQSRRAAAG